MKKTICLLTLLFLACGAVSCTQKPKATEKEDSYSLEEETLDVGEATYRFSDDTPVQWLYPFPDMAKPMYDSLRLHNNNLYVDVCHRNAVSYLRCDIQDPSWTSPFHDWYWDYVSRDLDTEWYYPDADYIVINEASLTTQQTEPFVVLVNGNMLQAISTYIDPNYGTYETRPNDPQRILWEHAIPSSIFYGLAYYNNRIYYLGREFDEPTEYGEVQYKDVALNVLNANSGKKILNWYPPQDVLDEYGQPFYKELCFLCQYENLYIMYRKPEFWNTESCPIYAFDMNTHTLAWKSETFHGGCSGGYELNGKLYFLDNEIDIIDETYAYALYGIDSKTGEKSDPSFISVSGTLKGVTETQFLLRSSGCFTSVNQEDMSMNWTYEHITGYSQPQEDDTIFLVKEDRSIQKVSISEGTIEQEWDLQAVTNARLSLYRNIDSTRNDSSNPKEYYSSGKNQIVVSKEGLLCAIYKEKIGHYSFKECEGSTYTEPDNLLFSVYGIVAIDVSKT